MGLKFLQKTIQLKRYGRTVKTVVIADRETAALYLSASAYLLNRSLEGLSIKSVEKYASIILSLVEEVDFDPELGDLDDLTDTTMSSYLEKILWEARRVSGNTLNQHKIVLSDFFSRAHDMGHLSKGNRFTYRISDSAEIAQAKHLGRQNSIDPFRLSEKYIPQNQFDLLLAYDPAKSQFVRSRNEIIFRLGYEVGLRAGEVTSFENLSLVSIDKAVEKSKFDRLNEIELTILGKGRHGGKVRVVVVPPSLKRKILRFVETYRSQLNGNLICQSNGAQLGDSYATTIFNRARKNLIRTLSLDKQKLVSNEETIDRWIANTGWTFHALRHSYATNLAMRVISGEDKLPMVYVQERLGHTHRRTTLIYCHFAAVLTENIWYQNQFSEELEKTSSNIIDMEFDDD